MQNYGFKTFANLSYWIFYIQFGDSTIKKTELFLNVRPSRAEPSNWTEYLLTKF